MIIYRTTNLINGKWYIGQDRKNNPNYLGSGIALIKAIKKYGKENFVKEILEYCDDLQSLNKKEELWIDTTNAVLDKNSYNLRRGGLRGPVHYGKDNCNFGKYPEHLVSKTKKSITCISDGKQWECISDAARFYGISTSKISKCCLLKIISCKGLKFRYLGQENIIRNKKKGGAHIGNLPPNSKKVMCIDNNMIFDSLIKASQWCVLNNRPTNGQSISRACRGIYKNAAGLRWSWYGN